VPAQGRSEPFFIVGAHRSGTTLLRFMLNSHPRLYLPPESEFIPALFGGAPERPLSRAAARRRLRRIFRLRFAREWMGGPPTLEDLLPGVDAVMPAQLIDALYTAYCRLHGAERWGDKTPTYTSHMDLLGRLFPDARFVHLVRDGRDVALSVLATWGDRVHVDLVFAARTWVRRVGDARRSAAAVDGTRYLELRYEDLVSDPARELRAVSRFLGETFHPDMLEPHRMARRSVADGSFHDAVRHPVSSERVARWRSAMSARDLRIFEALAGATLRELGYELAAEGPPDRADLGRVAVASVRYAGYRVARRLAESLHLRMPN